MALKSSNTLALATIGINTWYSVEITPPFTTKSAPLMTVILSTAADLSKAVEEAMKKLPEKSAEIFKKSRFENQSVKEIA